MLKRIIAILIISAAFLLLAACSEDEDRSFTIDNVTIDAQIDDEGIIHVRELYTYTFDGSFEGMTRSIGSDIQHFNAYLLQNNNGDPTLSTDGLDPLTVEKDDDTFKIYSESKNETKQVLYSYDVKGSVKKYRDIADVTYDFFDESNETDLHNVKISIHTPAETVEDLHFFFHEETGKLTTYNNHLLYTNDVLVAGKSSRIRLIFPTTEVSGIPLKKDKNMKDKILAAELDWLNRKEHLEENQEKIVPIMLLLIGIVILSVIFMSLKHPIRYRGEKEIDDLIQLLEKTDPLFVSYMNMNASLYDQSVIAALLSLKQRGVVALQEVPSHFDEKKMTFRFTWIQDKAGLDLADDYLREWLFIEEDDKGIYFLLESIVDNENEVDSVREKKAQEFRENLTDWEALVKDREGYKDLKYPFKGFSLLSIPLTIISFSTFYYFTTIDVITQTEQWLLPLIMSVLAAVGLIFNRNKLILSVYYTFLIITTLIWFTPSLAYVLTVIFYVIGFISLLAIPAHFWKKEIRKLKYAMNKAYHLMKTKRYPIGSDPTKIERRLEYAMILGAGREYAEQCGKEKFVKEIDYPLLNNPIHATESFNSGSLVLLSSVVIGSDSSTVNTTTSSTGGGGAGAF